MNNGAVKGQTVKEAQGIHIVAKPTGPACNLNCVYCYYLEKHALFRPGEQYRMPDDVLSAFITSYITSQPTPVVEFVWQGGEPTLLGIDFFKRVIELQEPFAGNKTIANSLQTNGTLLSDEWCRFLKRHNFMVGISLDGPKDIHDRYRRDRAGKGTFDRVMRGLGLLQKRLSRIPAWQYCCRCAAGYEQQGIYLAELGPIKNRRDESASAAKLWMGFADPAP